MVQYWDPDKAEGYFHTSWGWIVFVISLLMLYGLHAAIRWMYLRRERTHEEYDGALCGGSRSIATTAIFMHAHNRQEILPRGARLEWFPAILGSLTSSGYSDRQGCSSRCWARASFFFGSIDEGKPGLLLTCLSPYIAANGPARLRIPRRTVCPASGWAPSEIHPDLSLHAGASSFSGKSLHDSKCAFARMVLYWFWAHNRGVASEYWNKYYLVADS